MTTATATLLLPAGYGVLAGMRSLSAPALAARTLRRRGRWPRALGGPRARRLLPLLALGELLADKWSRTPDRTRPDVLAGRLAAGAIAGAAVAEALGGRRAVRRGAVAGAVAALASTFLFHRARRAAGSLLGSPVRAGLVEDALAAGLAALLARGR